MPREEMQQIVFDKIESIQEGNDRTIWMSGTQIVDLLPKQNPSSVRAALALLVQNHRIRRERRAGRGPKGRTGQASWYSSLSADPYPERKAKWVEKDKARIDSMRKHPSAR